MWQSAIILPHSVQKPRCSKPNCSFFPQSGKRILHRWRIGHPLGFLVSVLEWSTLLMVLQDTQSTISLTQRLGVRKWFSLYCKYTHTTEECFLLFLTMLEFVWVNSHPPLFFLVQLPCVSPTQQGKTEYRAVSSCHQSEAWLGVMQTGELLSWIPKLHSKAGWPWHFYLLALALLLAKKRGNSWSLLPSQQIQVL